MDRKDVNNYIIVCSHERNNSKEFALIRIISNTNQLRFHLSTNLNLSLVCPGKSLLEYCFDIALKSFSPRPCPPLAGSNVGLAAVVIFSYKKTIYNLITY